MIITFIIEHTDEEVFLYNAVEMIKAHIVLNFSLYLFCV